MKCEILTIGSELLLGSINDSNASYITQKLAEIGLICKRKTTVCDDIDLISKTVKEILPKVDVLIITGGLGSTHDDITREGLAKALSTKLTFQPILAAFLEQTFKKHGQPMPQEILRQAYLPEGAEPIKQFHGTAPGIIIKHKKGIIFALPGAPSEMRQMLDETVLSVLRKELPKKSRIYSRWIKTCGESELQIERKIKGIIDQYSDLRVSIIPQLGEVQLQLVAGGYPDQAGNIIDKAEEAIKEALGELVYGVNEETLEEKIGELLKKHKLRLVLVESCTGGGLSQRITDVAGSSAYFWGTMVAYSNEAKKKLAGVPSEELLQYGAVSAPVAVAMAEGGRHVAQVDIALSITGIAGPAGGTKEKPVGLVFIGLAWCEGSHCQRFQFSGSREEIRIKATQAALNLLRLFLLEKFEDTGSEVS